MEESGSQPAASSQAPVSCGTGESAAPTGPAGNTGSFTRHASRASSPVPAQIEALRRHVAVNVIGDNPPPLTAQAQDLIRATLGSVHTGKPAAEAA